jgi:hypothetical protein
LNTTPFFSAVAAGVIVGSFVATKALSGNIIAKPETTPQVTAAVSPVRFIEEPKTPLQLIQEQLEKERSERVAMQQNSTTSRRAQRMR